MYPSTDESANNKYYDEDLVDTDMLPTMLVYQDGELVHNWVRVDWEADRAGIEELLVKSVGLFFVVSHDAALFCASGGFPTN